jgi:hypothetical protein
LVNKAVNQYAAAPKVRHESGLERKTERAFVCLERNYQVMRQAI